MEGPRIGNLSGRQTADGQRVTRSKRSSPAAPKRPGCNFAPQRVAKRIWTAVLRIHNPVQQVSNQRTPNELQSGVRAVAGTIAIAHRKTSAAKSSTTRFRVGRSLPIKADSYSAVLAMMALLPLSDAEKAGLWLPIKPLGNRWCRTNHFDGPSPATERFRNPFVRPIRSLRIRLQRNLSPFHFTDWSP